MTFGARRVHRPSTLDELRRLVAAGEWVRAFGTGHTFNLLGDTPGDLISLAGLPPAVHIDGDARSVTVAAGVRYGELAERLDAAGWALANLASLPHISVAGAVATGTHGSGDRTGGLATAVSAMELVTADGDLVTVRRGDDGFAGAVVGLGALGIVTSLTLDLVPAYRIRQDVYDDLPWSQVDEHFAEIFASAYSVSLFTDWTANHVVRKSRVDGVDAPPTWFGGVRAGGPRHPIRGMPADNTTEQGGVPGPWHTRLPHFRPEFTPSSGDELQSEYLMPRGHGVAALRALRGIREGVAPVLRTAEVRTVAADDLWLSPSYGRDSVGLHFTWVSDVRAVAPALAAVEDALAPFAARPHWGKAFGLATDAVRRVYERSANFARLRRRFDPAGKFSNALLDAIFP